MSEIHGIPPYSPPSTIIFKPRARSYWGNSLLCGIHLMTFRNAHFGPPAPLPRHITMEPFQIFHLQHPPRIAEQNPRIAAPNLCRPPGGYGAPFPLTNPKNISRSRPNCLINNPPRPSGKPRTLQRVMSLRWSFASQKHNRNQHSSYLHFWQEMESEEVNLTGFISRVNSDSLIIRSPLKFSHRKRRAFTIQLIHELCVSCHCRMNIASSDFRVDRIQSKCKCVIEGFHFFKGENRNHDIDPHRRASRT